MIHLKQLNHTILREIGKLSRSINSINDIRFKTLNLQKGQYIYLTRICENPGINLSELTLHLRVDKTSTTKAVQKLENEGYIVREKDGTDSRKVLIYPTTKGIEIYNGVIEDENKSIAVCLKDFSQGEVEMLQVLIQRMNNNYSEVWLQGKIDTGGKDND